MTIYIKPYVLIQTFDQLTSIGMKYLEDNSYDYKKDLKTLEELYGRKIIFHKRESTLSINSSISDPYSFPSGFVYHLNIDGSTIQHIMLNGPYERYSKELIHFTVNSFSKELRNFMIDIKTARFDLKEFLSENNLDLCEDFTSWSEEEYLLFKFAIL